MRQGFLAAGLIAIAVALFMAGRMLMPGPAVATAALGDLGPLQGIVRDVAGLAGSGDLAAAKTRIADLETAWDDAEPTLRPMNPEAWGKVDAATDTALQALRAGQPDAAAVQAALVTLAATLADPGAGGADQGGPVQIGGIPVTDQNGHPLPCEAMLKQVSAAAAAAPPRGDTAAKVTELVAKATERCNADDDPRADAFSAAALQLLATN